MSQEHEQRVEKPRELSCTVIAAVSVIVVVVVAVIAGKQLFGPNSATDRQKVEQRQS